MRRTGLLLVLAAAAAGCDERIEPRYATRTPTPAGTAVATPAPEPPGNFRLQIAVELAQNLQSYPLAVWVERADAPQTFLRTLGVYEGGGMQRSALVPQWFKKATDEGQCPKLPALTPGRYAFAWNGRSATGVAEPWGITVRVLAEASNWGLAESDDWRQADVFTGLVNGAVPTPVAVRSILIAELRVEVQP